MPVTLFKDVISDRLSEFGFTRDPIETPPDPDNVLKERILSGDKIDIDIIDDKRFILTISESQYSRILSSSYWYSMQKVREQRRLIDTHNVRSLPLAWLLVTAYYSAFYSAVELSRLFGLYNLNLTQDQSSSVVSNSNSSIVLKKGTFSGAIEYELKDAVRIIFSRQDVKPHELAWKNMREILGVNNRNNLLVSKQQKFDLMNELLNSQKRRLKMPNNIRNEWNYAIPNAYDNIFCKEASSIYDYIGSGGGKNIIEWFNMNKRMNSKQNSIFSIFYLEKILFQTMSDMEPKIVYQDS